MPNPASGNCLEKGGELIIQTRGDGGQYGICLFEDNRQCDEWALFRGECPVGGVKITGYDTPEQVYCAIQGGKVIVNQSKTGQCVFSNASFCPLSEFFNGKCQKKY